MTKQLGQVLRHARQHLKLTQEQFAKRVRVSRAAIGQWENGEDPSTENLLRACEELGIEVQAAIEGKLKHKEGFAAVKLADDVFGNMSSDRTAVVLELFPYNTENYFLENGLIPYFPSSEISDGDRIKVSQSPMFFAPRPADAPASNSAYMLGVTSARMEPAIRRLSMVYVHGDAIPAVGDIVLVRLIDDVPFRDVTGTRPHKMQIGLIGFLVDFRPSEIVLRHTNPEKLMIVPSASVATMHRVLPPIA